MTWNLKHTIQELMHISRVMARWKHWCTPHRLGAQSCYTWWAPRYAEGYGCAHSGFYRHCVGIQRALAQVIVLPALNGPMLNNLVMSIRKCGVCFCLYEQADGSMEWPSLLGPDKLKLLKNLPKEFTNCQPAEMAKDVKKLWKVCSYLARHNGIWMPH